MGGLTFGTARRGLDGPQPSQAPPCCTKYVDNVGLDTAEERCRSGLFTVQSLAGHNGIVTAVAISDHVLITASQDTTVKVWDLLTGKELRSLGAHKQTVTAIVLLSTETSMVLAEKLVPGHCAEVISSESEACGAELQLVLSASLDCNVCIWSLDSGHLLHSVYTFNPLTSLSYVDNCALIITGSDGGKLELWDPATEASSPVYSLLAHNAAIVNIAVEDQCIYCGSSDGQITAFELIKSDSSLCRSFDSVTVHSSVEGRPRPVLSLAVAHGRVYYGDGSVNLKVIDCSLGTLRRLANHMTDFGSTDAICIADNVLVTSGYDIDNGLGYINVRSMPSERYDFTVCDERTPQIQCIACRHSSTGRFHIATGGQELKLWTQTTSSESAGETVESVFVPRFSRDAHDSDTEHSSDDERSELGSAAEMRLPWSHNTTSPKRRSWCSVI